jgi:hypothetical protein
MGYSTFTAGEDGGGGPGCAGLGGKLEGSYSGRPISQKACTSPRPSDKGNDEHRCSTTACIPLRHTVALCNTILNIA